MQEYKSKSTVTERLEIIDNSFETWATLVYLENANSKKYGSLMSNFKMQYSLGNDQYPKKLNKANDALATHTWDKSYGEKKKTKAENKSGSHGDKKNEKEGLSMSQKKKKVRCFCCGEENHYSNECPKKDNILREYWAIKPGVNFNTTSNNNNSSHNNNPPRSILRNRNEGSSGTN